MKISDLFARGAVFALSTSMWRARLKIIPSDLGIETTKSVRDALSLGQHRMAANKWFDDVAASVRRAKLAIIARSLRFTMIPGASYVPEEKIEELARVLGDEKNEFYAARSRLVASYDEIRSEALATSHQAILDAGAPPERADQVRQRIEGNYPSASEVESRFAFNWYVYTLRSVEGSARRTLEALSDEGGQVRSIVRGMVEGLRGDVQEKLRQVMEIVAKGGKVQQRTIDSAIGVLDRVEAMNIVGDETLTGEVSRLRTLLRGITPDTNGETLLEGLETIGQSLQGDMDQAVLAAEAALTGVGKRKLVA